MKINILSLAIYVVLITACSSGRTPAPERSSDDTTPVPDKPKVEYAPPRGPDVMQPVHVLTSLNYGSGTLTLETLGWCEKIGEADESFPCIEHEVGHLQQGLKSTYFDRTWTPTKGNQISKLESSLSKLKPGEFWNQSPKAWDNQSKLRSQTTIKTIDLKFDLPDYTRYLQKSKDVMLSRCLTAPRGLELKKMSLASEGFIAIASAGLTALTMRSNAAIESLEFSVDTNEVVYIAASLWSMIPDEYGSLLQYDPSELNTVFEVSLLGRTPTSTMVFEALNPRDDLPLQKFSFACAEAYEQLKVKDRTCNADLIFPLDAPDLAADAKASTIVAKLLEAPDQSGGREPKYGFDQPIDDAKTYWQQLPPTCSVNP